MQIKQTLNNPVNHKTASTIITIVVLGALIWGISCYYKNKSNATIPADESTNQEEVVAENKPATTNKPATGGSSVSTVPDMSYSDAIKAYEGRRMQFDQSCVTSPYQHTYKNGTKIMLDNRASVSRTIKIGQTVTVPAYGYKIVTLSANTFPSTILVDCDAKQNVATIIVQQ